MRTIGLRGSLFAVAFLVAVVAGCGTNAEDAGDTSSSSVGDESGAQSEEPQDDSGAGSTAAPAADDASTTTSAELDSTTTTDPPPDPTPAEDLGAGTFESLVAFCDGPGFVQTVQSLGAEFGFDVTDVVPDFQLGSRPSIYPDRDLDLDALCSFDRFTIQFTTFALGVGSDLDAWNRACQRTGGCLEYSPAEDGFVWGINPTRSAALTFDDAQTTAFRITFIVDSEGLDDETAKQVVSALVDRAPGPPYAAPVGFPCVVNPGGPPFCSG